MQSFASIMALVALVGQAVAQSACDPVASAIPQCAQSCIISADNAAGCAATDYACGCSKSAQIQQSAAGCVIGACPISSIGAVQSAAAALCSCVATATSLPTTTSATTTSTSTSSSSSSSTSTSTSPSKTTITKTSFSTIPRSTPMSSAPSPSNSPACGR